MTAQVGTFHTVTRKLQSLYNTELPYGAKFLISTIFADWSFISFANSFADHSLVTFNDCYKADNNNKQFNTSQYYV